MIWYIILFAICVGGFVANNFFIKDEKWQKIINITLIVLLCFTTGTRYKIGGYDYDVYERVYNAIPVLKYFDFSTIHSNNDVYGLEKGFLFLGSFLKTLGFTYHGFNLVCSIIFYSCFYFAFKNERKLFSFIIIIFLYKLFFFQTFVLTRQMLCLGLFFIMLNYIKNGNFFKYLFLCLLMTTIHASSLILLPVYFVRYLKITKKGLAIISLVFIPFTIVSLFDISLLSLIIKFFANLLGGTLSSRLENYISLLSGGNQINILNTLEYVILMLVVICDFKHLNKKNENNIYLKIFLILLPILTIFRGYEVLARVKDYFVIVYAFIIYELCKSPKLIKFNKKNMLYIVVILFCFAGYIRTLLVFDDGGLMPYNSYINDNVKIIDWGKKK